jgi:DNA repair exonuclease SbcCD ATPase subunit
VIQKEKETEENLKASEQNLKKLEESAKKIRTASVELMRMESEFQFRLNSLKTDKKIIGDTKSVPKEIEYITKNRDKNEAKRKANLETKDKNQNRLNFYGIIDNMFGDKGIKQIALTRIIPSLNSEIAKTLTNMHLEYRVIFDTEFNPTIRHLGYSVTQQQLSTGERKKIDFAILIALLRLIKIKNPGMNLFYLDEIFASLDADAVHHVLEILSNTSKELGLNIFVINHSVLPTEVFDYKISLKKLNNFSNLEIEKIN